MQRPLRRRMQRCRRGDGFQKRRLLAEAWGRFCGEAKPQRADEDAAKVVALRRRRAKAA